MKDQRDFFIVTKWIGVSNFPGSEAPVITTRGCACCSKETPLTQENLGQAISEASKWLSELRMVAKTIDWQDIEKQVKEYNE